MHSSEHLLVFARRLTIINVCQVDNFQHTLATPTQSIPFTMMCLYGCNTRQMHGFVLELLPAAATRARSLMLIQLDDSRDYFESV
jgi:hypothetical protein